MQLQDIVKLLHADLKNEWKHLQFYLYHASAITGLEAHEYKEFLLEQAAGEMKHVQQFSDLLFGLGETPTAEVNEFPLCTDPRVILTYAASMEAEVVDNYAERIEQLNSLTTTERLGHPAAVKWLEIFLEEQLKDSREDLDHLKRLLKVA